MLTCSFDVTVENCCTIEVACTEDLVVACENNGGAYVNWDLPEVSNSCSDCPSGDPIPGHIYIGEFDGHHYYCSSSNNFTWEQANAAANASGGHLVVINNANENNFIANAIQAGSVWIGLTDKVSEGNFEWVNDDPLNYTNWKNNQPDNGGNSDYAILKRYNKKWYDQKSYKKYEYVMEIPCDNGVDIQQLAGPANGSFISCLLYTSPSPRDLSTSRMPSSA